MKEILHKIKLEKNLTYKDIAVLCSLNTTRVFRIFNFSEPTILEVLSLEKNLNIDIYNELKKCF